MSSLAQIVDKLDQLPLFTRVELGVLTHATRKTLDKQIYRWVKQKKLVRFKRGVYVTTEALSRFSLTPGYWSYVANKLLYPSYVSGAYVLSLNQVIPEAVYPLTSVTPKVGRVYRSQSTSFVYKNISPKLFYGFKKKQFLNFSYYQASLSKALFDFLYYQTRLIPSQPKEIKEFVTNLRLDLSWFGPKEQREFLKYLETAGSSKLELVFKELKKHATSTGS